MSLCETVMLSQLLQVFYYIINSLVHNMNFSLYEFSILTCLKYVYALVLPKELTLGYLIMNLALPSF